MTQNNNNFSLAWQSNLLRKRLLSMRSFGKPLYTEDDLEFWTSYKFLALRKGKTIDEIIDETWEDYYTALEY